MELRWTQEAAADLERIADYLFEHTPDHAERLVRALYDAPATLLTFPNRGRPGKKEAATRHVALALHRGLQRTLRHEAAAWNLRRSTPGEAARSSRWSQPRPT